MAYNDEAVKAKLSTLNETQESIVTVAQWIMFHRRHADRTATLWLERVKDSNANKRLNLIYLANEVVQQSKARKRDDFLIAFSPFVPEAVSIAFRGASTDIRGKIRRVVEVWRQRDIFDESIQVALESRMKDIETTHSTGGKRLLGGSLFSGSSGSATSIPAELKLLIPFQEAVSQAEVGSVGLVGQAEGDAHEVTAVPDAAVPVRIALCNKALKSIARAESSMAAAVKSRKNLQDELEKLAGSNRDALLRTEQKLESLRLHSAKIKHLKQTGEDSIMRRLPSEDVELSPELINDEGSSAAPEPAQSDTEELRAPPVEDFTPEGSPEADVLDHDPITETIYAVRNQNSAGQHNADISSNVPELGADLMASLSRPYSTTDMAGDEISPKKQRLHGSDLTATEYGTGLLADDLDDLIKSERS